MNVPPGIFALIHACALGRPYWKYKFLVLEPELVLQDLWHHFCHTSFGVSTSLSAVDKR